MGMEPGGDPTLSGRPIDVGPDRGQGPDGVGPRGRRRSLWRGIAPSRAPAIPPSHAPSHAPAS
ncbi:MAG: ATP-binding protein, partial [Candidatus Competibacterales bacterium]